MEILYLYLLFGLLLLKYMDAVFSIYVYYSLI